MQKRVNLIRGGPLFAKRVQDFIVIVNTQLGARSKDNNLDFLGVEIDPKLNFGAHHTRILNDIKARIGIVRRLTAHIPRGALLWQVAHALVVGRLQCAAWITRPIHGLPLGSQNSRGSLSSISTQTAMNDLARVLLGVKRSDHIKVSTLADRAGLPTVNQIVIRGAATAAWVAFNGGPLKDLLVAPDSRTRASTSLLFKQAAPSCAATNMAMCWQASEELRSAKNLPAAKLAARKLALKLRFN